MSGGSSVAQPCPFLGRIFRASPKQFNGPKECNQLTVFKHLASDWPTWTKVWLHLCRILESSHADHVGAAAFLHGVCVQSTEDKKMVESSLHSYF